jgi:PEGA domain
MREPNPPAASPASSYKGAELSVGEIKTPTLSVQTETQLSTSPTAASQESAIARHLFLSENGDDGGDCALMSDAFDLLSRFPFDAEAKDITQEPFVRVMPVGIKKAKSESVALADLRGQLHQTERALKQSVEEVGAFKTELDQLRDVAVRLTGEYNRIEAATRTVEERSAAAAKSESMALADQRGQLHQTEMVIKQSVEEADAFKIELDQLREVAARLTGEYRRIEDATRTVEERSTMVLEIVNAIETRLGPLAVLQDLSRSTDARLTALNALAEPVTRKVEALEGQKDKIDYALAKGNRVAEVVSATEARIAILNTGNQPIERTEEVLASEPAEVRKVNSEFESHPAHFENRMLTRSESARSDVEDAQAILDERDTAAGNIDVVSGSALSRRLGVARRNATRAWSGVSRVLKPAVMFAAWSSLGRWLTSVMTVLRTQQTPRPRRHHAAVIGGLGVVVLVSFIVSRSLGDANQIGGQPVVSHAQPGSASSALVLPEVTRSTTVPSLPRPMLITAGPTTGIAKTTTAQPLLKAQPPLKPQPPVDAQSPPTTVRSPEFIGTLDVQSDPMGAAVFINRQLVGETPLRLPQLRAGSHVIWIEREGYQRWTAAVRVVADTVTRVDVKLQLEPVRSGIE